MEIFTHTPIFFECDGCKKAFRIHVPLSAKIRSVEARIRDHHREQSPQCPRDQAYSTLQRAFVDGVNQKAHTPHFRMGWRDVDELDLTKEEKRTPTLIISP